MGRAQIAWEIPVLRSGSSMCGGQLVMGRAQIVGDTSAQKWL